VGDSFARVPAAGGTSRASAVGVGGCALGVVAGKPAAEAWPSGDGFMGHIA
jgi:hypothetical protein